MHEGCDRAAYYEQGDFAKDYNSPKCQVKIGCWGPVVNCNVTKRGWMDGVGGCPNVGGICIGCTMPGFPDKFMPFMDEPPGGELSPPTLMHLYGPAHPHPARRSPTGPSTVSPVAPQPSRADLRLPAPLDGPATNPRSDLPKGMTSGDRPAVQDAARPGAATSSTEVAFDPITRIVGNLGIYTKIDFPDREVVECRSTSSIFRGYSVFMKGKDPRDAHFITSRICGICGDNHATCSVYAQNMAYGVKPPPLADWIINLGEAAEYMFDHTIFQDNLVFVDYCERMVKETNPGVLERAERTAGPARRPARPPHHRRHHALVQPLRGRDVQGGAGDEPAHPRDVCLMEGRHVHPSTLYPGGVGTVATPQLFTDYLVRLTRCLDFVKRAVAMNDDVFDFFYEALPGYEEVGRRRTMLGCWGASRTPKSSTTTTGR